MYCLKQSRLLPDILHDVQIAVFSGLRLAKFNIDERQTSSFLCDGKGVCILIARWQSLSFKKRSNPFFNPTEQ